MKVSILVLAGLATFQLYANVYSVERTVRLKIFSFSVPIARSATSGKGNNISTTAVPDLGARRKESAGRSPGVMKALWDRVNRHLDWLRSSTDGENSSTPAESRAKLPVCNVTPPGLGESPSHTPSLAIERSRVRVSGGRFAQIKTKQRAKGESRLQTENRVIKLATAESVINGMHYLNITQNFH